MTAAPRQFLPYSRTSASVPADLAAHALRPGRSVVAPAAVIASTIGVLLGFTSLMPYLAVSAGKNTAIQFGNVVTVMIAFAALRLPWRSQPMWIYPALMLPLCLGCLNVALGGGSGSNLDLSLKALFVWALAFVTVLAVQVYAPRHSMAVLGGVALATIVHVIVGVMQWHSFANGEFPLLWMYQNPSFLNIQNYYETIARYIQRPFGIFPEPSAMSSSLAPWVLLWIAETCGLVRFRQEPSRALRMMFNVATCGAIALLIASQSGHAAITLAAALLFAMVWFVRCKATWRNYIVIVTGIAVLSVVLLLAVLSLSNRVSHTDGLANGSWEDRYNSLIIGFELWVTGGPLTALIGMGPGMTPMPLNDKSGLEAVWSVSLVYLYESGIVGLVAMTLVGRHLWRCWKHTKFDLPFAVITIVWLVGVTVTTSYNQLQSLWLTLGWLTVWPAVCVRADSRNTRGRAPETVVR